MDAPKPFHISFQWPIASAIQQAPAPNNTNRKSAGTVWRHVVMVRCFRLTKTFQ